MNFERFAVAAFCLSTAFSSLAFADNPFSKLAGNYFVTSCGSKILTGDQVLVCMPEVKALCVRVTGDEKQVTVTKVFDGFASAGPTIIDGSQGEFMDLPNGAMLKEQPADYTLSTSIVEENGHLIYRLDFQHWYTNGFGKSATPEYVMNDTVVEYRLKPAASSEAKKFNICDQ